MPTSTVPWPATSAAAAPTRASAPPSTTRPRRSPEEPTMSYERLMQRVGARHAAAAAESDRRAFLKLGAGSGFALGLFGGAELALAQPAAPTDAALKPYQQP